MTQLSESQKIILAKLKFRNKEKYDTRLTEIGIIEEDIQEYITRERDRREGLNTKYGGEINAPKYNEGHVYKMGGKPYWSQTPVPHQENVSSYASVETTKKRRQKGKKILILVDGDNHPYEALGKEKKFKEICKNAEIRIYISDKNQKLIENIKKNYIDPIVVAQGNQAVDNRIKTHLGQEKGNFEKIAVISHDKGYDRNIKKYNKEKQCYMKRFETVEEAKGWL